MGQEAGLPSLTCAVTTAPLELPEAQGPERLFTFKPPKDASQMQGAADANRRLGSSGRIKYSQVF